MVFVLFERIFNFFFFFFFFHFSIFSYCGVCGLFVILAGFGVTFVYGFENFELEILSGFFIFAQLSFIHTASHFNY